MVTPTYWPAGITPFNSYFMGLLFLKQQEIMLYIQGTLLLTWINFNPSIDKESHTQ